jgi:hypothetical protein
MAQGSIVGSDPRLRLLDAACRAFHRTRFYHDLYEVEPVDDADIPYISSTAYHQAYGILDCIVDREQIVGVLPSYRRNVRRFPFTVVEDAAELVLRQRRIVRALEDIGVPEDGACRFLIIADDSRGPFACEVSKGLYWEGHQASIFYLNGVDEDLQREVRLHDPDYTVLTSGRHLRRIIERPTSSIVVVEHCDNRPIQDLNYPALLYADECDLIGSRAPGRAYFDYDDEQLLLERVPASRATCISTLAFSCFPFMRYALSVSIPTRNDRSGQAT